MSKSASREHRFAPTPLRRRREDGRLRALAIEQLCHAIPIGAAVLDAYGTVLFCNREGMELLSRWHPVGPLTKARWNTRAVPPEIIAACDRLRSGDDRAESRARRPSFGGRVLVRNVRQPNLTAVVALDRSPRDRRCAIFSVVLQDALRDGIAAGRRDQLALLTLAERRVAKLVAEGLRNNEIAAALGKSVMTVKSQLGTIFSKLAVRSRTQLAAALRSSTFE